MIEHYSYKEHGALELQGLNYFGIEHANKILKKLGLRLKKGKQHYQVTVDKAEPNLMLVAVWESAGGGKVRASFGITILGKVLCGGGEAHSFCAKFLRYISALERLQKIEVCAGFGKSLLS